jgi:hypothetical protein
MTSLSIVTSICSQQAPPFLIPLLEWYSVYLLYWYKSTNTDTNTPAAAVLLNFSM